MTFKSSIGGEMEIAVGDFQDGTPSDYWPTFGKAHVLLCDTGRSAFKLAIVDWIDRKSDNSFFVWLPSYICPSVLSAVRQVHCNIRLYENRPGQTNWDSLLKPSTNDLVVIVHYFGVRNVAAIDWLRECQYRDWGVIEDCVQAPYTDGAGTFGDYALTSLRKWWPVPDGAIVASNEKIEGAKLMSANEEYIGRRLVAKLLRAQSSDESMFLRWIEESEELLGDSPPREVSWVTKNLISKTSQENAKKQRQKNWAILSNELKIVKQLHAVFDFIAADEVPLVFPILCDAEQRNKLRAFLRENKIFCPVHWILDLDANDRDMTFSLQIISIPIDQRYDETDMYRVISTIKTFFEKELP